MKVVIKNSNYVKNIRRNSPLGKEIKSANGNGIKISKALVDSYNKKGRNMENVRNVFINLMSWGLIFSCTKVIGNYNNSEILNNISYYVYGFTGVCGAMGAISQLRVKSLNREYYRILGIYYKLLEEEKSSDKKM